MKKQLIGLGVAAMLALTASPSFATFGHGKPPVTKPPVVKPVKPPVVKPPVKPPVVKPPVVKPPVVVTPPVKPPVQEVPEIDAANAGLALALIGGLVAIRRERRNRA